MTSDYLTNMVPNMTEHKNWKFSVFLPFLTQILLLENLKNDNP